jgi:hypothetical protein
VREFKGLEFLTSETGAAAILAEWRRFWPSTSRQQTCDAVGRANEDWLLVEAKANHPEFCSPPTTIREGGLGQIERALARWATDGRRRGGR